MAENTKIERWTADKDQIDAPLHWRKPRHTQITSDLFHESVPFDFIDKVFAVMYECQQHVFQLLTKCAERMAEYFEATNRSRIIAREVWSRLYERDPEKASFVTPDVICRDIEDMWPLPNVWLGVSCEDQQRADERIPHLLNCPAVVRFLSCEPLLGPIDIRKHISGWHGCNGCGKNLRIPKVGHPECDCGRQCRSRLSGFGGYGISPVDYLDWAIVGGESGPGARPMHPDWARSIRDQCVDAGVAFFFKQWGEWMPLRPEPGYDDRRDFQGFGSNDTGPFFNGRRYALEHNGIRKLFKKTGKKAAGRLLDGRTWDEMPSEVTTPH